MAKETVRGPLPAVIAEPNDLLADNLPTIHRVDDISTTHIQMVFDYSAKPFRLCLEPHPLTIVVIGDGRNVGSSVHLLQLLRLFPRERCGGQQQKSGFLFTYSNS